MPSTDGIRNQQLLDVLETHIQFRELSSILKAQDVEAGTGWKQLLDKVSNGDASSAAKIAAILSKVHHDLLLAGNKQCFVYCLEESEVTEIRDALNLIEPGDSRYAEKFPLPLGENELVALNREHILTKKIVNSDGDISLIFCASRTRADRQSFKMSEVTEAVRTSFQGFDSFIAIKTHQYQVFDIVTLRPTSRRLEILIDQPDKIREPETAEERCITLLGLLVSSCQYFQSLYEVNSADNFFPCISSIYGDNSEGRIIKLAFRAPSKSVKRETVSATEDLRHETFHEAGYAAVGTITPFDITVKWDKLFPHYNGGTLRIQSSLGAIANPNAVVRSATISHTKDDMSVKLLVNKLVKHMT